MATRSEPWPNGTPCWVDLSVPDVTAAVSFYGAVFGWTAADSGEDFGHYHICSVGDRAAAGIGPIMAEGQPAAWMVYLASDDVDGTAKSIGEAGGTVIGPPMDIPGNGRMCIAMDNVGAAFGIWQAAGMNGVAVYNEPGGLTWEDGRFTDPDAARTFYADVFGYHYAPIEGESSDYTTFDIGGDPLGGMGGMMGVPDGTPSHWVAYFSVADTDTTVALATGQGGSVLGEPVDTPFGRMAFLTDPHGAMFAVVGPVAES